ncbi:MAG: hypothetical protein EBZ48_08030, partial [Proteobacteria bacterium]|nr:hypothetical protein [Pseudomonadota bacterium]
VISLLAGWRAIHGDKVDVLSSNSFLAHRDFTASKSFFQCFGLTSVYHGGPLDHVGNSYADIMFSTPADVITDYLSGITTGESPILNRKFQVAIMDEADNTCVEPQKRRYRLLAYDHKGISVDGLRAIAAYVRKAGLNNSGDIPDYAIAQCMGTSPELKNQHPSRIKRNIRAAIIANHLKPNIHYDISPQNQIIVIDLDDSGRLLPNQLWGEGVHTFLALKHDCIPSRERITTAAIAVPTFLQRYHRMYCLSATMGERAERQHLRSLYNMKGFDVPWHHPHRRIDYPISLYENRSSMHRYLCRSVQELVQETNPRPVLILADAIAEALDLHQQLGKLGIRAQLLTDKHNHDSHGETRLEGEIIKAAGTAGTVTVATTIAGRGADIRVHDTAAAAGGLHTIITFIPTHLRAELQARGRSGRQGAPGTSEIVAALENDRLVSRLPKQAKSWIQRLIRKAGPHSDEVDSAVTFCRRALNHIRLGEEGPILQIDAIQQTALNMLTTSREETSRLIQATLDSRYHKGVEEAVMAFYRERWGAIFEDLDQKLYPGATSKDASYSRRIGDFSSTHRLIQKEFEDLCGLPLEKARILPSEVAPADAVECCEAFLTIADTVYSHYRSIDAGTAAVLLHEVMQKLKRCSDAFVAQHRDSALLIQQIEAADDIF